MPPKFGPDRIGWLARKFALIKPGQMIQRCYRLILLVALEGSSIAIIEFHSLSSHAFGENMPTQSHGHGIFF
jgi:hypothetical protein